MEVSHEIKVGVMRYLEEVAAQLDYLTPEEREVVLQNLYARIGHALAHSHNGSPTLRDLQHVLAEMPQPRRFKRQETRDVGASAIPGLQHGQKIALLGAALLPFSVWLFLEALKLACTATSADKLKLWDWLVMLVGFQAPMIITMLGIMSIASLREAPEPRGGMALAVCVTLTFPLLLIDGTLLFLAQNGLHGLWSSWVIQVVMGLLLLALDIRIVRSVWHTAARPADALG